MKKFAVKNDFILAVFSVFAFRWRDQATYYFVLKSDPAFSDGSGKALICFRGCGLKYISIL